MPGNCEVVVLVCFKTGAAVGQKDGKENKRRRHNYQEVWKGKKAEAGAVPCLNYAWAQGAERRNRGR